MDESSMQEMYRLTKENNRMLHAMRRNAFLSGIVWFVIYLLMLGLPIWLYFTYLSPVIKQFDATLSAATGKSVQLEGQFKNWGAIFEQIQKSMTRAPSSSSSTSQ